MVTATGVKAFVTHKANTKDMKEEEKWNQGEAWTGEDGILTKHEAFKGVAWPGYQSVVNHVVGETGLLKKNEHLYKQGREQDEPAAAGAEGTKDETALGDFERGVIEVAELYAEAKQALPMHSTSANLTRALDHSWSGRSRLWWCGQMCVPRWRPAAGVVCHTLQNFVNLWCLSELCLFEILACLKLWRVLKQQRWRVSKRTHTALAIRP